MKKLIKETKDITFTIVKDNDKIEIGFHNKEIGYLGKVELKK